MTTLRPDREASQDDPASTGAGLTEDEPVEPVRRQRPRRRWGRIVVAGVAVAAVAGVAASAALGVFGGGGGATATATNLPPATAEVTRTTLVATERYDGVLGYGPQVTWSMSGGSDTGAEGSGGLEEGGSEIVTWLPEIGEEIARGEPVFSVNAEPVVLMYGSMPFYRPLWDGSSGPDVEQLEKNLEKLDYEGFTVDDEYTEATAEVVGQWQEDVGLPDTGQFEPTRAMVADGAIRIADHLVTLGSSASGQVMSYTGTDRQITVELDVVEQPLVEEDLPVTVTLPDDATVDATVAEVGTVATGSESEGEDDESLVIEVTITVDDSEELGDWDEAPVKVNIETDRREDVLAVPVGALVALGDGDHGVQVVDGDETSYVPVETGLFADGMVEITDGEIAEGTVVGVPS